jgi:hypothetical protein
MTALSGGKQTNGWGCLTSGASEAPKGTLRKRAPRGADGATLQPVAWAVKRQEQR